MEQLGLPSFLDSFVIVLVSSLATLFIEALSWFFVYRTPSYKRNCQRVKELSKKCQAEKLVIVSIASQKSALKKLARLESELKLATESLSRAKLRMNIFSGVFYFALYQVISRAYAKTVVGVLPFEPFPLLGKFTHRGLEGEDMTEFGFGFIYSLSTMSVRTVIQKGLGFTPPRSEYDPMGKFKEQVDSESLKTEVGKYQSSLTK